MAEPTVHQEIEVKLEVPAGFRLPRLDGAGGPALRQRTAPRLTLVATYFDTDDLRLARHHMTLRHRTGGHDDGWHVKLPHGGDHTRDEVCLPLRTPGVPPVQLVWLVMGFTRGWPLMPVATLTNERRPTVVFDGHGPLAEITDDHVTVDRDDVPTLRFREVEVEAAEGRGAEELRPVVDALIAAGARPGTFRSKAVRALGERALDPPDVGSSPVRVAGLVSQLQWNDLAVRRGLAGAVDAYRGTLASLSHSVGRGRVADELRALDLALCEPRFAREALCEPRYLVLLDDLIAIARGAAEPAR